MTTKKTPHGTNNELPNNGAGANAGDGSKPVNIAPATEFEPSGAPTQTVPDVDPAHPAVDANPRADTTVLQNRIDFNDPTIEGHEAVEQQLAKQG